jgi:uncharacterized membrane protein YkvA (DUF1232 family)
MGQRFVETMRAWLLSLPHDLKIFYEASTDENLEQGPRVLATGAIIYAISPNDFISADRADFTSYADDCIIVRIAAQKVLAEAGEDAEFWKSRFPEFFEPLDEQLGICREAMGELYDWLALRVEPLRELLYKGNKPLKYVEDDDLAELLYQDGLAFATNYPVNETDVVDRFKKPSTILDLLARRKADEDLKRT